MTHTILFSLNTNAIFIAQIDHNIIILVLICFAIILPMWIVQSFAISIAMRLFCRETASRSLSFVIIGPLGIIFLGMISASVLSRPSPPWWLIVICQFFAAWLSFFGQQKLIFRETIAETLLARAKAAFPPTIFFSVVSAICTPLAYWAISQWL